MWLVLKRTIHYIVHHAQLHQGGHKQGRYYERGILFELSNLHVRSRDSCAKSETKETAPTVQKQYGTTAM